MLELVIYLLKNGYTQSFTEALEMLGLREKEGGLNCIESEEPNTHHLGR